MKQLITSTCNIFNAKQVADLTYWVSNITILVNIITKGQIVTSQKPEFNPEDQTTSINHVSFSRGMRPHLRDPRRWNVGIQLDGSKLSARYSVRPYSYLGSHSKFDKSHLIIEIIASYSDSSFTCKFKDWPEIPIERSLYKKLKSLVCNDVNYNHKYGNDPAADSMLIESYQVNSHVTGVLITYQSHPAIMNQIAQQSLMNEEEERIWAGTYIINIRGCIKSIIVPRDVELLSEDNKIIDALSKQFNIPIVAEVSSKI